MKLIFIIVSKLFSLNYLLNYFVWKFYLYNAHVISYRYVYLDTLTIPQNNISDVNTWSLYLMRFCYIKKNIIIAI